MNRVLTILEGPETSEKILIYKYGIDMTTQKMLCLRRGKWLNSEVINFYMEMLMERDRQRSKLSDENMLDSHFFSSYFMSKLLSSDLQYAYKNVMNWSKTFKVFEKDKIFIPVNIQNVHWAMLVVYIRRKKIRFYDSKSGMGCVYVNAVMKVCVSRCVYRLFIHLLMYRSKYAMVSIEKLEYCMVFTYAECNVTLCA